MSERTSCLSRRPEHQASLAQVDPTPRTPTGSHALRTHRSSAGAGETLTPLSPRESDNTQCRSAPPGRSAPVSGVHGAGQGGADRPSWDGSQPGGLLVTTGGGGPGSQEGGGSRPTVPVRSPAGSEGTKWHLPLRFLPEPIAQSEQEESLRLVPTEDVLPSRGHWAAPPEPSPSPGGRAVGASPPPRSPWGREALGRRADAREAGRLAQRGARTGVRPDVAHADGTAGPGRRAGEARLRCAYSQVFKLRPLREPPLGALPLLRRLPAAHNVRDGTRTPPGRQGVCVPAPPSPRPAVAPKDLLPPGEQRPLRARPGESGGCGRVLADPPPCDQQVH